MWILNVAEFFWGGLLLIKSQYFRSVFNQFGKVLVVMFKTATTLLTPVSRLSLG